MGSTERVISPNDNSDDVETQRAVAERVKVSEDLQTSESSLNGSNNNYDESEPGANQVNVHKGQNGTTQPPDPHQGEEHLRQEDLETSSSKKGIRLFWHGVVQDLKNKDLLPLKILFFFKYATLFVLYPFLTLHLKSLGLDATEAGINSALIPVVSILGPPFSGVIADKIGNFKVVLTVITLLNAPLALALLLVPVARETVKLPETITFSLSCDTPNSPFFLQTLENSVCQLNQSNARWKDGFSLPETVAQCGTVCELETDSDKSSMSPFTTQTFPFTSAGEYLLPDEKSIFEPFMNKKTDLICDSTRTKCFLAITQEDNENYESEDLLLLFGLTQVQFVNKDGLKGDEVNVTQPQFRIGNKFTFGSSIFNSSPSCSRPNPKIQHLNGTCRTECLVQYNRTLFCSNTDELKTHNVALTFGLYTLIRILLGLGSATSFILFEGAVLAILKEFGGDYGLQRVSATLAAIIAAPLSGALIQVFHHFNPAFYLYAVLQVVSALLTLKIDLSFKPPAERIFGRLKEILSQVEILIFFVAMLVSGTSWGYLESFLFWFLQDLNGSNILMGLTISVGGIAGIPLLICSRPIIKQLGHVNILCLGLVFYCVRLIGYSYIEDPWLCLPFEAMEAVTASLAITAAATYAAALSSPETIASIQGMWGGLYFGVGRGAGSLLGGFFHKWYGARNTFRIFSFMSLIAGVLYFIVNVLYIEKYSKQLRKGKGIDLTDIKGDKYAREQRAKSQASIVPVLGNSTEMDSMEKYYDGRNGGYIGPCDINKFTDVPLDEETPECQTKFTQNITNRNNRKSGKSVNKF